MIDAVIANVATRNENHTANKTRKHFRVKDHTNTGDKAEYKTEYWHNRE